MQLLKQIGYTLYRWWMAFARFLGTVNAVVLLTIVYIFVIGLTSLIARFLRKDLMSHHVNASGSFWQVKEPIAHTVDQARHQF